MVGKSPMHSFVRSAALTRARIVEFLTDVAPNFRDRRQFGLFTLRTRNLLNWNAFTGFRSFSITGTFHRLKALEHVSQQHVDNLCRDLVLSRRQRPLFIDLCHTRLKGETSCELY